VLNQSDIFYKMTFSFNSPLIDDKHKYQSVTIATLSIRSKISGIIKQKEKNDDTHTYKQFWLAVLIIAPAFILIVVMFGIQSATVGSILNKIDQTTDASKVTALNELLDSTDRSNQTLFNILLPVFSAWVGVVIAFYFGSEQTRRVQDTLDKAISPEERLSGIKVEKMLADTPSAKDLKAVTMKQTIKEVNNAFGNLSNVVVIDDNQKPLGLLYKVDFLEAFKEQLESSEPLGNLISNIKQDFVTKSPWNKDTGRRCKV
jgi:hypothetical protein